MDGSYFHYKARKWYMPLLRRLTLPLRRTFFVRERTLRRRTDSLVGCSTRWDFEPRSMVGFQRYWIMLLREKQP